MSEEKQTQRIFLNAPTPGTNSIFFRPTTIDNSKLDMIRVITSACSEVQVSSNNSMKFCSQSDCTDLTVYIRTFFNVTYYLGMSPFRFSKDYHGNYIIKKWKPQQIFCGLMNLLSIIRIVTEIRLGLRDIQQKDTVTPVEYFENVMNFFSLAYKSATIKSFWFNQHSYLRILTISHKNRDKFSGYRPLIVNPWIVRGIFALFSLECFADLVAGKNFIVDISKWSPSLWITRMVELSRYTFFLDLHYANSENSSTSIVSAQDKVLAAIMSFGMFQRYIFGFFCDLCIFSCSVTLWAHANVFSRTIGNPKTYFRVRKSWRDFILSRKREWESDEDESDKDLVSMRPWSMVYKNFTIIQKICRAINYSIGAQVTLYIAESVMYYSLNLNAVMTIKNILRRVDMIYFYFLTFGTFIFAADVGKQLECLKNWITFGKNRFKVPTEDMNIVLHEMLAKDVGIRGSNSFTITYPFLAALLSTTVTIFIISVQSDERGGTDDSYLSFVSPTKRT